MQKFFLIAAVLLAPSAFAAESKVIEKPLVAQSLDSFNQESAKIREQMQPGGLYSFIKGSDRTRVDSRLDFMQKLLSDHAAQNDMSQSDKIALVNAQEEVNGILRHNDNNRLVCESRAPIGSNIPVKTCRTYGEIEEGRRTSQQTLNDLNNLGRTQKGGN
jgi:hypothetical protein